MNRVTPAPHPAYPRRAGAHTHPNCAAACGGSCGPRSATSSGPRGAGPQGVCLGLWVTVRLPAAPSGPCTSRVWSGPLISEAALWGLCSLLLVLLPPGPPPLRADVAAVNQFSPAAPPRGGILGSWDSSILPDPKTRLGWGLLSSTNGCPRLGPRAGQGPGAPAWFRLERREEGTGGRVAVPCSH